MNHNQNTVGQTPGCLDQIVTNEETLNQSFEDLEEPQIAVCEDSEQIILEQTNEEMESNEYIIQSSRFQLQENIDILQQEKMEQPQKQKLVSLPVKNNKKEEKKFTYCKRILEKLHKCKINGKQIEETLVQFEQDEKKYIQKIKIIYAHFILGTKRLKLSHFEHLKAFLVIPKYGQELVEWGNTKYDHRLTVPTAIERVELIEQNAESEGKCQKIMKIMLLMLLCILAVKLLQ